MTPEAMRTELTRMLESWNGHRSKGNNFRIDDIIIARMQGMIELAYNLKIISDAEKAELEYIYYDEEVED